MNFHVHNKLKYNAQNYYTTHHCNSGKKIKNKIIIISRLVTMCSIEYPLGLEIEMLLVWYRFQRQVGMGIRHLVWVSGYYSKCFILPCLLCTSPRREVIIFRRCLSSRFLFKICLSSALLRSFSASFSLARFALCASFNRLLALRSFSLANSFNSTLSFIFLSRSTFLSLER